ncbi:MAG: carboxypeptidase regulatory-like domain-containing protein, partial [Candidatus Fermentibacteraceae bacterium]|nr:carboxypeptidase regulatory-like domain-containing protein [Candidatus Fermentibacteraceae bacterium]
RILFEVPGRVDASYWNTPWDTTAVTQREYLNYQPDSLFGHSPRHLFWREFIPEDREEALRRSMADAETCEEAVIRVCNFQSHSQPGGLMTFGYMTNDLQPMTIYSKAYGSCGEQSILQTALSRICFIPAYVVGCRGEDHQWNQYLDPASGRWNHWDINYGISGIGNIWVSGEGVNHAGKTISTISAFGPGGRVWPVTCSTVVPEGSGYMQGDSGYTATAGVEILVSDPAGTPVEGAMVLARSHWNNANSVSIFDYTDSSGSCVFNLGWEPGGGYTIDVLSPFGSAGSRNISFQEDSSYTVNYTVPCMIPDRQAVFTPPADSCDEVPVVETLYTVPYFTGSLYSIDSDAEDIVRGSDWIPWRETPSTAEVLYMDGANFRNYSEGLNCNAVLAPFVPRSGDSCFAVLDNRNSMFVWRTYSVAALHRQEGSSFPEWLSRPTTPRNPVAGLCVSGSSSADSHTGTQLVEFYSGADVFQDDPDDPLSAGLIAGPFRVPSGERSISIQTSSQQTGLDVDLFFFRDTNGNRMLDGMEELQAKSTSPSSSETVFIPDIDTDGIFWTCVQGWQVPEGQGTVDMGLSFQPEFVAVYSLSPTGFQADLPERFSFETAEDYSNGDIFIQSGESVLYPENTDGVWYFEPESSEEFFAGGSVDLFLSSGELLDSMDWSVVVDSVPPEVSIHSDGVDYLTMKAQIEVEAEDELSGVEDVTLYVDSLEGIGLSRREDSVWVCSVDFLPYAGEAVNVRVSAADSAGNEAVETFQVGVVQQPEVVFSSVYPTGTVYDHTPVLQVAAGFRNTHSGWTAVAELYGNGSAWELSPVIKDGTVVQFLVKELLADGEYTATVDIIGDSGETPGTYRWSFTVETMDSTR